MSRLIRNILFIPASLLISWLVFTAVLFVLLKFLLFFSALGILQNGPVGEFLFGQTSIAMFIVTFFAYTIFGHVFVLSGSLIAPEPRKIKSILLFIIVAIFGIFVFDIDGNSIAAKIVQYLGILFGGLQALVKFTGTSSETGSDASEYE